MRVAVTSQNFRTISGHAGKSRRFLILDSDGQNGLVEVERLDLPSGMSMHEYHGDDHPLLALDLDALITQSAGRGFVERLARHGIPVHATSAQDPATAVRDLAAGRPLPAAAPHDDDHDHDHGHGQDKTRVPLRPR
jgi:predicted Fe-Mo cluster-binding NifX family protein